MAQHKNQTACYQSGSKTCLWVGIALIAIGLLVIFLCVPLWAWLFIAAAILIALGFWLMHK